MSPVVRTKLDSQLRVLSGVFDYHRAFGPKDRDSLPTNQGQI